MEGGIRSSSKKKHELRRAAASGRNPRKWAQLLLFIGVRVRFEGRKREWEDMREN